MAEDKNTITEDVQVKLGLKTLIVTAGSLISTVSTGVYAWVDLKAEIQEAKELPRPGTGQYTIDKEDANAVSSWSPTRTEYMMKDNLSRITISRLEEEIEELKQKIKELEDAQ